MALPLPSRLRKPRVNLAVSWPFRNCIKALGIKQDENWKLGIWEESVCFLNKYPPGNKHIPPWEKENHLQNAILGGYVSSLEGISNSFLRLF